MNVEKIKTIILRYRDLSNKNTIELHKKLLIAKDLFGGVGGQSHKRKFLWRFLAN